MECSKRRLFIPMVHVRGTHYDVGYNVGRTFKAMIEECLDNSKFLNQELLPLYETPAGRQLFEKSLEATKRHYPQYIREIEGISDGANVPFHVLYLLHTDLLLPNILGKEEDTRQQCRGKEHGFGCTAILVNMCGEEMMGHNEDTEKDYLDHMYFVSAHIIEKKPQGVNGTTQEKFTALCYAGFLPGYTMGYNYHGLIQTINTIDVKKVLPGKIPRHLLCRALLSAQNVNEMQTILEDSGIGIAEGVSVNVGLVNEKLFYNIEAGPNEGSCHSQVDVVQIAKGEQYMHANMLLRLKIPEHDYVDSSVHRHKTFESLPPPTDFQKLVNVLGDESQPDYNIYRHATPVDKNLMTICTGIFNLTKRSWFLYSDNPKTSEPVAVWPIRVCSGK